MLSNPATIAVALLLPAIATVAQDAPAIDRTDPVAVAKAYVEACRTGDVDTMLSLLAPDDPVRAIVVESVREMGRDMEQQGFSVQNLMVEFLFVPLKLDLAVELADSKVEGDQATVRIRRDFPVEQQILLGKRADGTWQVRLLDSVKATTGRERTFLETQQGGGGGAPGLGIHASYNRLRVLYQAIEEYARDHDNRYPPAGTWMDAIEPYVLDPDSFKCPAAPELAYGYAMNAALSEQELQQDWNVRRTLLLLFEWPGGQRNASAMPEELAAAKSSRPDGTIAVVDATGNTRTVQEGTTWADVVLAGDHTTTCRDHLQKLVDAARKFARDNEGRLPGRDTWEADIALYLMGDTEGEAILRCPAAPELDYAYAINEELAGKNARQLTSHDTLILFFESDLNVPNATGLPSRDAPAEGRHVDEWNGGRTNGVAYLSGMTGFESVRAANP